MGLLGLAGKVAIVTGAAQGIGAASARRLVAEGCRVVAVDLQAKLLAEIGKELGEAACHPVVADAASEEGCNTYVEAALARFGAIDLMLNNVGMLGPVLPLAETSLADFEQVFAVNVRSVFLGLRAGIRQMRIQNRGGAIVNVASMAAVKAAPNRCLYGASKRAIIGLANSAAMENGPAGIRINTLLPGAVDTPMSKIVDENRAKMGGRLTVENYPIARKAQPAEIAAFIAWLLSDEASYQTGGVHPIDGGASL